jgi:hypothetical protein
MPNSSHLTGKPLQHNTMITAGTYPPVSIDFGKDEPGMILQREVERDQWIDYQVDGKPVDN